MNALRRLGRSWWLLPVLAITVLGTLLRGPHEHYVSPGSWAGVLGAVAVLALLLREDRPELAVAVNAAAVAVYFAVGYPDGPIYLSVLLSTFALASRRPARDWTPYVIGALVVILAGLLVREAHTAQGMSLGRVGQLTWFVALDAAAAALGLAIRNRRQTHEERARRTATEEQLRMAQDLHDGVGHGLAVIAMQAGVALHVLDKDPAAARASLLAIRDTSRESLQALRAELSRLAPGPGDAPRSPVAGLADLPALVDRVRAGGLDVTLDDRSGPVPDGAGSVAYLVVQEALTNVLRHADASTVRVVLVRDGDSLRVTVRDDGRGVGPVAEGMGIPGMRSRAAAIGGTLEAGPMPEGGFQVVATLPAGTAG